MYIYAYHLNFPHIKLQQTYSRYEMEDMKQLILILNFFEATVLRGRNV